MGNFLQELKRRNVIKSAMAYLVVAWVLIQVFQILLPMVNAPEWVLKILTLIMAIGLPIWIIISWIYEITPEGIEITPEVSKNRSVTEVTNKRLNAFIIVSLSIAVIVLGFKLSNSSSDSDERYAIAVLPFDNMNVDEDNDWIIEGLTIDIHTYLSKIENLTIISAASVKAALDSKKTLPEIAELLNVTYFVGGSVRQFNDDIKINVHLTNTSNEKDDWVENYNRNLDNPFKVQQDVSQNIVAKLKIKLTPEEEITLQKFPTENSEAYALYTKGHLIHDSRKKEDLELNIELNKQAIALDPNFAQAYAEIAQSTYLLAFYHQFPMVSQELSVKNTMPYLEKALQLDPTNAMAYGVKGMIAAMGRDWNKGQEYFEKAIVSNPNSATIRYQYAVNSYSYNYNEHLIQIAIAQKLDPLSVLIGHQYFASLINNNKIKEAEKYFNKYRFLYTKPGEQLEKESVIIAYKNKDWTAAIRFFEAEIKKDPNNANLNRKLGEAYDGILLDNSNYIKYTKKAYELDSTNKVNRFEYIQALLRGRKFKKVKELIQSQNFKSLISKPEELNYLFIYYYQQENYKKAQDLLKDPLMFRRDYNKAMISAQLGDRNVVFRYLGYEKYFTEFEVPFYATLKEKDSMYIYLEKIQGYRQQRDPTHSPRYGLRSVNSMRLLDPYRKEERYKALLRKHYLPITHWNE